MSTQKPTSKQVRQDFFEFFQERDHELVPSGSLVPKNDPTLLFTNAGMNQFKDVFLGTGSRPYDRAVDTQKCLRVSGKHNDLDEVGHDTYHHTFFEMLGNWSFGDYFKREAIAWAWELLVDKWGLDPDRLYATVHEGDDSLGLDPDTEAADLWTSETDIDPEHVLFCPSKDNFWMMGDTGPCGPCSEVHIDLRSAEERERKPGRELVNADVAEVMEIWNLVFIQYNALPDGSLEPLDDQHVDTGMGFERMVDVLQNGTGSTYDTDLFAPLLQQTADLSPLEHVRGYDDIDDVSAVDDRERERIRIAMRVVADHIRTIAFAIADGVTPGPEGRGYVIRRILRRAVRYGYTALDLEEPFLYRLLDPLRSKMSEAFPELDRHADYIRQVIQSEEESFLKTLASGISFFERVTPYVHELSSNGAPTSEVRARLDDDSATRDLLEKAYIDTSREKIADRFLETARAGKVPGEVAFLLHDTYGFPIDLTRLMAREQDIAIDMDRYDELMQRQKERARAAASFGVDQSRQDKWTIVSEGPDSEFVGYNELEVTDAAVRAFRTVTGEDDERYELILDRTPFYAESGGQVGDTGTISIGGDEIRVLDTQKKDETIVHIVDRLPDTPDRPARVSVDPERRERIKKHHTATHLLHAALREHLGSHVKQKGSLVAPDRLRFDFSHFERVDAAQLRTIERTINTLIQRDIPKKEERSASLEDALDRGAMALFGEKYGDDVRVITFDEEVSIELCGGTHVNATGEIGLFRFLSEGSVASGVRRVEAVAGIPAIDYIEEELESLDRVREQFASREEPIEKLVGELLERERALEKEVARLKQQSKASKLDTFIEEARSVDGIRLVTGQVQDVDSDMLQNLGEQLRDKLGERSVGILGAPVPDEGKVYLVVSVSDDLIADDRLKAGDLAGKIAQGVGGGGGGRPSLATAGGRKPEKLEETLGGADKVIQRMLHENAG